VGYRKGAGHVSRDGAAVVAVSADRQRFREVAELHVPGDNRDPKLLPLGEDRLAMSFPSWVRGHPKRELQQYITFSENGFQWETPRPILPAQKWLWRIRPHEGRYYALVVDLTGSWENGNKPHELEIHVSDDLLQWELLTRVGPGLGLNESDMHFNADGEAWLVARTVHQDATTASYFAAAKPPYTDWETTPMKPLVHAPIFLEHEGALYVAGRSSLAQEGVEPLAFGTGPGMSVWRLHRGELEPVLRVPASGDCSYPGLIHDPEGRICMSYYSQHAYHLGVVDPPTLREGAPGAPMADVFYAELELP
jgi:hypothetical protein